MNNYISLTIEEKDKLVDYLQDMRDQLRKKKKKKVSTTRKVAKKKHNIKLNNPELEKIFNSMSQEDKEIVFGKGKK